MVLQINHLNKIGNKKCLGGTNLTNDLSILIRSILKITYYIILLYTFFNVTMLDCFSQSKDSHIKKFSFLVSSGLTLHTDGNIYKRDGLIAIVSVDYLELGLYYSLSQVTEIGVSFGKNVFTQEAKIYQDSSGFTIASFLQNYQWAAINFKINWGNKWYIGVKFGTMEPDNGHAETLMGIYLEKEIFRMQSLFSRFKFEYDARTSIKQFHINSNQINFIICLGFNL